MNNKAKTQILNTLKPFSAALLFSSLVSFSANAYTLIDLGPNVEPKAINNVGVVVGSSNTEQYPSTAFSWSVEGGMKIINGGIEANAVNDNGLVAGNTVDGAFIANREWSDYGAFGVNQTGMVAGYKVGSNPYQPRSLPYNPAIYNGKQWEFFDIARLYPRGTRQGVYADRFILNAINEAGLSVGYKYRYGLAGSSAILINTNGQINDYSDVLFLPTPAGGQAADINNNNKVIGITGSNTRTIPVIYSQAFVYDYDMNNFVILPILEGGLRSRSNDINENNEVVGSSESAIGGRAVLWVGETVLDLNDEVNAPQWVLTEATAINDNGDIVGIGLLNGSAHGFVLTAGPANPPATENQRPEAIAYADVYSGKAPLLVTFDSTSSNDPDGAIVAYAWDFMDGGVSSEANPAHEFTVPGKYLVSLTVTDDQGAAHSTQIEITVRKRRRK